MLFYSRIKGKEVENMEKVLKVTSKKRKKLKNDFKIGIILSMKQNDVKILLQSRLYHKHYFLIDIYNVHLNLILLHTYLYYMI